MSDKTNPVDGVLDRMVEVVIGENEDFASHSDVLGIPLETIKTWRRRGEVPAARLKQFAEEWGVPIDRLLHGENRVASPAARYSATGLPSEFLLVPRYDVRAGAGSGQVIHDDAVVDHLAFKREWITGVLDLDPRRVALLEVHGDSMAPGLDDGDLILVDLRNSHKRLAGVYVIQLSGHLWVKRLKRRMDGGVDVISDNPAYGTEQLGPDAAEALTIVGRVVWAGRKM